MLNMYYILYINLALLVPALTSSEKLSNRRARQWKLKTQTDPKSSMKIAKLISQLAKADTQHGIDMDYFGDSIDRMEYSDKRSEDRRTELDERLYSPKNRVRLIYVSNPEVLEQYKKKLKKIRVERGSSTETEAGNGEVSYKDILQFLVQVDARLRELDGRPTDGLPILSPSKLNKILQNLRRHMNSEDYVPRARNRAYDETGDKDEYRGHTFPMKSKESRNKAIYESDEGVGQRQISRGKSWDKKETWTKQAATTPDIPWKRERDPMTYKQRDSWEKPKKSPSWNRQERFPPRSIDKGRVPNFISTPIPLRGPQGIYESDK